jgi:hypothetical protein
MINLQRTGNGAPACKICGTAYKTAFRKPDGRTANLLEMETAGMCMCSLIYIRMNMYMYVYADR